MNSISKQRIVVIGGGGHAKVIIDLLQSIGIYQIVGCLDGALPGQSVLGVPVLGDDNLLSALYRSGIHSVALGVGNNSLREKLACSALKIGYSLPILISPSAYVSDSAQVSIGTAILPRAVIHTQATIGKYSIINTGAIVEHDCTLGTATHIAPGATLTGCVSIGERCFVAANATVVPNTKVTNDCIVGAGAVVISDLIWPGTYVGAPARLIRKS